MTDHTADDLSPEPAIDDVTAEQLAAEPALAILAVLRATAADSDALVQRIEGAATAELMRRRSVVASRPQLVVLPTRGLPARRRPAGRDLAALLARALRPALLAAAASGVLAFGLSRQRSAGDATGDAAGVQLSDASAVQALSLHDPTAQWADQARAPTVDALGRAIGLGGAP